MNRLDFHSVATLLQNHLIETADMTQIVFISTLFSCFVNDSDFSFDEGLCCKWMKGQAKISPKIVSYYQIPKHQEEMYADMEEEVFLTESAIIHQNHVKALELEEKAIAEACGKGTTHIFNLSSMYLDASSYFMKLIKQE